MCERSLKPTYFYGCPKCSSHLHLNTSSDQRAHYQRRISFQAASPLRLCQQSTFFLKPFPPYPLQYTVQSPISPYIEDFLPSQYNFIQFRVYTTAFIDTYYLPGIVLGFMIVQPSGLRAQALEVELNLNPAYRTDGWACISYWTSLSLSFLICKTAKTIISISEVDVMSRWNNEHMSYQSAWHKFNTLLMIDGHKNIWAQWCFCLELS